MNIMHEAWYDFKSTPWRNGVSRAQNEKCESAMKSWWISWCMVAGKLAASSLSSRATVHSGITNTTSRAHNLKITMALTTFADEHQLVFTLLVTIGMQLSFFMIAATFSPCMIFVDQSSVSPPGGRVPYPLC